MNEFDCSYYDFFYEYWAYDVRCFFLSTLGVVCVVTLNMRTWAEIGIGYVEIGIDAGVLGPGWVYRPRVEIGIGFGVWPNNDLFEILRIVLVLIMLLYSDWDSYIGSEVLILDLRLLYWTEVLIWTCFILIWDFYIVEIYSYIVLTLIFIISWEWDYLTLNWIWESILSLYLVWKDYWNSLINWNCIFTEFSFIQLILLLYYPILLCFDYAWIREDDLVTIPLIVAVYVVLT